MKRILSLIIILSLCIGTVTAATYEDLIVSLEDNRIKMADAHETAEIARKTNNLIMETNAKKQWNEANIEYLKYLQLYRKWEEYPVATYIWEYLKNLGYNDYIASGILGNIMAETGGHTLDIQWNIYSYGYYGICMWSLYYCREVNGASLEGQCDYLRDTIEYQINYAGFCYRKGFNYNSFIQMTDASEAALAFAKAYERCGSGSYRQRQRNAIIAYEYFTN